tara:strand:- start:531 stop:731 length:201 start_codon:yes stop_codon:yes gene_type:complete
MKFKYLIWLGVFLSFCLCLVVAANVGKSIALSQMSDYHCAKIVKVSTMKEAKKQIEINKVMTGVKG